MPVQISYKKQVVLGILIFVILVVVVELFANIWLYEIYQCDFEENEVFKDTDKETLRKICLDTIGLSIEEDNLVMVAGIVTPGDKINQDAFYINSHKFRGPEITKEKPEDTVRIFVLGGSTTFGVGVLDHQTYPFYLQEMYDDSNLGFNVQVINAGWPGRWSLDETNMIKGRLQEFDSDVFLVYDGWNEVGHASKKNHPEATPELWMERWKEICNRGEEYGYSTIVTIQPLVDTGNKILTDQEKKTRDSYLKNDVIGKYYPEVYPIYLEKLNELKNHCTLTADLTGIFDGIEDPIYFDFGHTGSRGNKIIAEKFYSLSLPFVLKEVESSFVNLDYEIISKEKNVKLILNDTNTYFDDFYSGIRYLISPYKTPKVFSMIFD